MIIKRGKTNKHKKVQLHRQTAMQRIVVLLLTVVMIFTQVNPAFGESQQQSASMHREEPTQTLETDEQQPLSESEDVPEAETEEECQETSDEKANLEEDDKKDGVLPLEEEIPAAEDETEEEPEEISDESQDNVTTFAGGIESRASYTIDLSTLSAGTTLPTGVTYVDNYSNSKLLFNTAANAHIYTITGTTTTCTINFANNVNTTVILDDVNITRYVWDNTPFLFADTGTNINIQLKAGSTNIFHGYESVGANLDGFWVTKGTLTIDGTGTLDIMDTDRGVPAGINNTYGKVIINNGNIKIETAGGAGIGGRGVRVNYSNVTAFSAGTLEIYGGDLTITTKLTASAIGGGTGVYFGGDGYGSYRGGNGGPTRIDGGNIKINAYSTGIGGAHSSASTGYSRPPGGASGAITINGGNLEISSGRAGGAAIGAGYAGSATVTINGGKINVTGNGGGIGVAGGSTNSTVTITGGIVSTEQNILDYNCSIGGDWNGLGYGTGNNYFSGGNINARRTEGNKVSDYQFVSQNTRNGASYGNQAVYSVQVSVRNSDGTYIPGVEVQIPNLPNGNYTYKAVTDENGLAYVWIPAGTRTFKVNHPGYGPLSQDETIVVDADHLGRNKVELIPPGPPMVTAPEFVSGTSSSISFKGQYNPLNDSIDPTSIKYQYRKAGDTTWKVGTGSLSYGALNGRVKQDYTGTLTGLEANTKYEVRAYFENSLGGTWSSIGELVTLVEVTMWAEPDVSTQSATIRGTFSPGEAITGVLLSYGTDATLRRNVVSTTLTPGEYTNNGFSYTINNLAANQIRYYRLVVTNSSGKTTTAIQSFRMISPPKVAAPVFTGNTKNSVNFSGTYNPQNSAITSRSYQYRKAGTSDPWISGINLTVNALNGLVDQNYSGSITGLDSNTEYEIEITFTNANGTTTQTGTFTTLAEITVNTPGFSNSGGIAIATLSGNYGQGSAAITNITVTYAEDAYLTTNSQTVSGTITASNKSFTAGLTGLAVGQKYYYQVEITNAGGSNQSTVHSFSTGVYLTLHYEEEGTNTRLSADSPPELVMAGSNFDVSAHVQQLHNVGGKAYYPLYYKVKGSNTRHTLDELYTASVDTEITIYYTKADTSMTVSIPTELLWAAFESDNGAVVSPDYVVTNQSDRPVDVSLSTVTVTNNDGISFVANVTGNNQVRLDIDGVNGTPFAAVNIRGLDTTGSVLGTAGDFGRLGGNVTPALDNSGKFKIGGFYQGQYYGASSYKQPELDAVLRLDLDLS